MNRKKIKQKPTNFSQERLQEIGKILGNGIIRLEAKEREHNKQVPVDNKQLLSLHTVGSNLNQQE